jgi:WD40 repeat protein
MDFSPDSRWILTLYLKTWGSGGGSFASMPFGKHIDVMGGGDQAWTGQVWEANSGKRHLELHGSSNALSHAFSPDGHYLAIGLREGTVQLWDVEHRQELFQWHAWSDRTAADSSPRHLAFTADSAALAVADTSSPTLRLLDLPRLRAELAQVGLDW